MERPGSMRLLFRIFISESYLSEPAAFVHPSSILIYSISCSDADWFL